MVGHVCPWWTAYTFDNVFRRLLYKPEKLFAPHVDRGMTAMDVGCGMGFNAIGLARIVGDEGRVIAVDLQRKILDVLTKRARRTGVDHRIQTHLCTADSIGIDETVDFVVAFWMVHEVPDASHLLRELHACLRAGGKLFVAEPKFHVSNEDLDATLHTAETIGLKVCDRPRVRWSRSAVLVRQ